jgi:microcystin-dependent protein
MAIHDYVINNDTAANVRQDINNALAAIRSSNLSPTEPTTVFAGLTWFDTANNELKLRNEANDGWIVMGRFDNNINTAFTPAGAILTFAQNSPPDGWLKCNGQLISRTTYSTLFSAIGTTYGAGNGTTTFKLPELRGEFIRGLDDGRGVDSGRTLGSFQSDLFKSHSHTVTSNFKLGTTDTVRNETDQVADRGRFPGNAIYDPTYTAGETGGTETRPRNIALLYCIKY